MPKAKTASSAVALNSGSVRQPQAAMGHNGGPPLEECGAVEPLAVEIPGVRRYVPVGRSTTYRLIGKGELETIHIGRRRLVTMRSIRALVDRLAQRAA
jgi:hypothetical protein